MTPEDEIECLIHQSIDGTIDITAKSQELTAFPNVYIRKLSSFYEIGIGTNKVYPKNSGFNKSYEELIAKLESRKITIKNKTIFRSINIMSTYNYKIIPIYYKDCIFTDRLDSMTINCENCIYVRN